MTITSTTSTPSWSSRGRVDTLLVNKELLCEDVPVRDSFRCCIVAVGD